jgi:hypothetical protein
MKFSKDEMAPFNKLYGGFPTNSWAIGSARQVVEDRGVRMFQFLTSVRGEVMHHLGGKMQIKEAKEMNRGTSSVPWRGGGWCSQPNYTCSCGANSEGSFGWWHKYKMPQEDDDGEW